MTPIIYIASPYTTHDDVEFVRFCEAAMLMSEAVIKEGGYALSPVLNSAMGRKRYEAMQGPQWWYDATMDLLRRCDGLLGWSNMGRSSGVLNEGGEAAARGMPRRMVHDPFVAVSLTEHSKAVVGEALLRDIRKSERGQ